ncbi:MAG TPA: sugar phosphate isomerase/epimerase family protein [Tepidisphaeraceae bacterium]|jgi:sugar phosphate isomerase/epimerase
MKFAFSTIGCPIWDFDTIVMRAKEYGYDGVELRGFSNESILTASNVFLTDPEKIRRMFGDGGIEICCLASSIAYERKRAAENADELRRFVEQAQRIGAPAVKIFDVSVKAGRSRSQEGLGFGDWLLPLADFAADHDVAIWVENALSYRSSKELWAVVDRIAHPSVGVCWDVFNAAMIGEPPSVSVPTLNNRIQYTQVRDAKLGALGATYCKLGEGDVPVRKFLTRLRGIGYEGYVTLEWEKAWLPNLAEPEEIFPDSIVKLREWTQPLEVSDWEAAAGITGGKGTSAGKATAAAGAGAGPAGAAEPAKH